MIRLAWVAVTKPDEVRNVQIPLNEKPLIHVVDDDASVRDALESLLDSVKLQTKAYAAAGDFLSSKLTDRPGCIVLDIRLPDMNGLQFYARLTELGVMLPVVIMTGYGNIPMTVRAMKYGAVDFLPKPFQDQDMIDAVVNAVERDLQRRAIQSKVAQVEQRYETLTRREQEVMLLVATGKLNKQIAADLGIQEITVKIHRGAAMRKMAARTFADLVRMAEILKPSQSS
jgi:FixJ family two-component response regulator